MCNLPNGLNTQVNEIYTDKAILIAWHDLCYNFKLKGFGWSAHFKISLAALGKK